MLTGIAALVTAIVGLATLLGGSPSGPPQAAAVSTTGAAVSQASTASPVTSATSVSGAVTGAPVRGRLSMSSGDEADLARGRVGNGLANADLSLLGNGVGGHVDELTSLGGSLATVSGEAIDRAACVAALRTHGSAYALLAGLQVGSQLCLDTSDDHVAVLRVVGLPGVGASQFVFTYTVWR